MDEETIVRTYADMVYKIAFRYVRNPTEAEDVFSDTFLAYFLKERVFENEEHRKAWLIRVTINCAKRLLKKRGSWQELDESLVADARASDTDEYIDLRTAIERLRPEYREVICLFYLNDLPVARIAEVLNRNENTVKIHLSRGRAELRRFFEE